MFENLTRAEILAWLVPAIITIGAILLGLAAAVGLCLLVLPSLYFSIAKSTNRWIIPGASIHALDRPVVSFTRFFYRHHIAFGIILAAGSLYGLISWALDYNRKAFLNMIDPYIVSRSLDWMIVAAEVIHVLLLASTLILSIIVIIRPSVLKRVEEWADQWFSSIVLEDALDQTVELPETILQRRPRLVGGAILAICLIVFSILLTPALTLCGWFLR